MISYRIGRYRWNIPFRYLNRYRNKAELYRPKYRGVPARFGCSGGFRSFSAVFAFPAGTNLNGFLKKNFILTTTGGHHWSISVPDHQQNHLLLHFSHLDLLLRHWSPFVCFACFLSLHNTQVLNVLNFTLTMYLYQSSCGAIHLYPHSPHFLLVSPPKAW